MINNFRPFSTSLPCSNLFLIARRIKIFRLIIKHKTNKSWIHLISKAKAIAYISILFNIWSVLSQCPLRGLNINLGSKLLLRTIKTFNILELVIVYLLLASKVVAVKGIYSILTKFPWLFLLGKKLFEIMLFKIFRRRTGKYRCW